MPQPETDKSHTMYFQLRYITNDFDFVDTQIDMADSSRKMTFVLRRREPQDTPTPPLQTGDGFLTVTCERELSERIQAEATSSGQLSLKKGPVREVHSDMYRYGLRTLHLIRWRTNSEGKPHPIRSGVTDGFMWSFDGTQWKPVMDCLSMEVSLKVHPQWSVEAEQFVKAELTSDLDEPLGQELLREAWTNRKENPRSCIVLAVAAAEVGFKQFAANVFPDTAWLLESLQSPPLVKMLTELFPWSKLNVQINGQTLTPPESVTTTLVKAVKLRNDIVHGRLENLNGRTVTSVLTAVRDLLYFLDAAQGQRWALDHISGEARKHFPQIKSWPLRIDPLF
jgi:hypothetical protein